jgi:DNA-binding response OmpR family regulator
VTRILVVEDNDDLAFGLQRILDFEGYDVEVRGDAETGLDCARDRAPDLVVLDVMLPGEDGFRLLRRIRHEGMRMPVLMLTARGSESDVLMGFDSGADDYVTKPFSTPELLARVRALLRRTTATAAGGGGSPERFGDVEVDAVARTVRRAGQPVDLAPRELDLLLALLERRGAVASRADLLAEVWKWKNTDVETRTVDIHVAELRRKLEDDPSRPRHILTVRKAGYRLER